MNCKQYRSKAAAQATNRWKPPLREQNEMAAHCAGCPLCARFKQDEEALIAAWRVLGNTPAPDILPQLAARLDDTRRNQALPAPRAHPSRKTGYFGSLLTAGATIGVLGAFAWLQNNKTNLYDATTIAPRSVATQPAVHRSTGEASLTEMLTEVRWRSSKERQGRREPPSYNEATRSLLLSEQGVGK